jgi:predicted  nucleic acid-binding Zn-ribbon protein
MKLQKNDTRDRNCVKITRGGARCSVSLRIMAIAFSGLMLVSSPLAVGGQTSPVEAKERPAESKSRKMAPQEMEKLCNDFAALHRQRTELEQQKDRLLDQITDAKARLDVELSPLKRSFTRREIDKLATQWHEAIGKSQNLEDQERDLMKQILQSKDEFLAYLRGTVSSLEEQLNGLNKSPEENADRIGRLEKRLERVRLVLKLVETLQDKPEILEEVITAPPEPPPFFGPPPDEAKQPRDAPPGLRLHVMRLEKEIQFLRSRLDRFERELQTIEDGLRMSGEKPNPPE